MLYRSCAESARPVYLCKYQTYLSNQIDWQASLRYSSGAWQTCVSSAEVCWGERCHKGSPDWFHLKSPLDQTQNSCMLNLPMCTLAYERQKAEKIFSNILSELQSKLLEASFLCKTFLWLRLLLSNVVFPLYLYLWNSQNFSFAQRE